MTKTGMKAPQGTGMVVASADIQNCRQEVVQTGWRCHLAPGSPQLHPSRLLCLSGNKHPAVAQSPPEVKGWGTAWEPDGLGSNRNCATSCVTSSQLFTSLCLDFQSLNQGN